VSTYFDLENPVDLARLSEPMTALESLRRLIVIDEVQRHPDLFPILRVLLDRKPVRARFLILGSASPELLRQSSETLAGRVAIVEMGGFTLEELERPDLNRLWLRGGFPRSYLTRTEAASTAWREDFIRTFLERDLAQLKVQVPSGTMRRFWTMTAHYSGGILTHYPARLSCACSSLGTPMLVSGWSNLRKSTFGIQACCIHCSELASAIFVHEDVSRASAYPLAKSALSIDMQADACLYS
jgi:hypothetical protein